MRSEKFFPVENCGGDFFCYNLREVTKIETLHSGKAFDGARISRLLEKSAERQRIHKDGGRNSYVVIRTRLATSGAGRLRPEI